MILARTYERDDMRAASRQRRRQWGAQMLRQWRRLDMEDVYAIDGSIKCPWRCISAFSFHGDMLSAMPVVTTIASDYASCRGGWRGRKITMGAGEFSSSEFDAPALASRRGNIVSFSDTGIAPHFEGAICRRQRNIYRHRTAIER